MTVARTVGHALLAGAIAIGINIFLLNLADRFGVVTARGGLQRLVKLWLAGPVTQSGIGGFWVAVGLPGPDTAIFKTGFKVAVGLGMALFYAVALEPRITGSALSKGLAYAVLVWLLNALIVLPLLGEGPAGSRVLTPLGMIFFALAHTAFFVVLALVYEALRSGPSGIAR